MDGVEEHTVETEETTEPSREEREVLRWRFRQIQQPGDGPGRGSPARGDGRRPGTAAPPDGERLPAGSRGQDRAVGPAGAGVPWWCARYSSRSDRVKTPTGLPAAETTTAFIRPVSVPNTW